MIFLAILPNMYHLITKSNLKILWIHTNTQNMCTASIVLGATLSIGLSKCAITLTGLVLQLQLMSAFYWPNTVST